MTTVEKPSVAKLVNTLPATGQEVHVSLSNELVVLLSDQLYQSPVKAIEELVINSYDADASNCNVYVPTDLSNNAYIAVFDDGEGMDAEGLVNLWQIGRSNKRHDEIAKLAHRKLIGRFGIGKLATFTLCSHLTYISKKDGGVLAVTTDFSSFENTSIAGNTPITLPIRKIDNWIKFKDEIKDIEDKLGINIGENDNHWTLAILESLKVDKLQKLTPNTMAWILSTAMPLRTDFSLSLNSRKIESSKEKYELMASFNVSGLAEKRLESLKELTGEEWKIRADKLYSKSFPNGISASVIVTKKIMEGNKSDDIARSHGFFIRVRGRLVNTSDPQFADKPWNYGVFSRLRAEIDVDDLDTELKASRENFEDSSLKSMLQHVMREIFNEASTRRAEVLRKENDPGRKMEGQHQMVAPDLIEYPVADAIIDNPPIVGKTEVDGNWRYLGFSETQDSKTIASKLYSTQRTGYKYRYRNDGDLKPLVQFDPESSIFWINSDHKLAKAYNEGQSRYFLEDFATAETMLEVYMREARIDPLVIQDILSRRDLLIKSLTEDHSYSLKHIAESLRNSGNQERELEILLVVAARSLGFIAEHVSNSGKPDGIARLVDYSNGEIKIILEAKSSKDVPKLGAIDFAGLAEHKDREGAQGCLLLAPSYPAIDEDDSAAAYRARQQKISCWTIPLLAQFIEAAEGRQVTTRDLLKIVTTSFAPIDVESAVQGILADHSSDYIQLYRDIIEAFKAYENRMTDVIRNSKMILGQVNLKYPTDMYTLDQFNRALNNLAKASQGGLIFQGENIIFNVSINELERRVAGLTKYPGEPRRVSNFRANE